MAVAKTEFPSYLGIGLVFDGPDGYSFRASSRFPDFSIGGIDIFVRKSDEEEMKSKLMDGASLAASVVANVAECRGIKMSELEPFVSSPQYPLPEWAK